MDSPSGPASAGVPARNAVRHSQPGFVLMPSSPQSARDLLAGRAPVLIAPELAPDRGPTVIVAGNPCDEVMAMAEARPDLAYLVVARPGLPGLEDPRIDDVLYDPPTWAELELRAHRVLARKSLSLAAAGDAVPMLDDAALVSRNVRVELSLTEARLVRELLAADGAVVPRHRLALLLDPHARPTGRAVDTHIYRLRQKLHSIPGIRIETLRQRGFRLALDHTEGAPPPRLMVPPSLRRRALDPVGIVGDPVRRRILDRLRSGDCSAAALSHQFDLEPFVVAEHLRLLRLAGLVDGHSERNVTRYRLRAAPLLQLDVWLGPYRGYWSGARQAGVG